MYTHRKVEKIGYHKFIGKVSILGEWYFIEGDRERIVGYDVLRPDGTKIYTIRWLMRVLPPS